MNIMSGFVHLSGFSLNRFIPILRRSQTSHQTKLVRIQDFHFRHLHRRIPKNLKDSVGNQVETRKPLLKSLDSSMSNISWQNHATPRHG